jgi:hypothetical protein
MCVKSWPCISVDLDVTYDGRGTAEKGRKQKPIVAEQLEDFFTFPYDEVLSSC